MEQWFIQRPRKSPAGLVFAVGDELGFGEFALLVVIKDALIGALELFEGDRYVRTTLVEFLEYFQLDLMIGAAVMGFAQVDDILVDESVDYEGSIQWGALGCGDGRFCGPSGES